MMVVALALAIPVTGLLADVAFVTIYLFQILCRSMLKLPRMMLLFGPKFDHFLWYFAQIFFFQKLGFRSVDIF